MSKLVSRMAYLAYTNYISPFIVARDSSVDIATHCRLDGPGIISRWGQDFSAPVQIGPVALPASCTVRTGSVSLE